MVLEPSPSGDYKRINQVQIMKSDNNKGSMPAGNKRVKYKQVNAYHNKLTTYRKEALKQNRNCQNLGHK